MVKINLEMKASLEYVQAVAPDYPTYNYSIKVKCVNCGETSGKWHDITPTDTYPTKEGQKEVHFVSKCKFCGRENTLDVVENTHGKYRNEDQGQFKPIITFDCRGLEPIDFNPTSGWIVEVEDSNKVFHDVDLSDKEWVEYDEKSKQSVGIYELETRFNKTK